MLNPNTGQRELAYVTKVLNTEPLSGYDKVHLVTVLCWKCVAPVTIQKGDLVVYFEVDSLPPSRDSRFEFLAKRKFRIKPIKMCGVISQGLVLSISDFPELKDCKEGDFVTEKLGVTLYEDQCDKQDQAKPKVTAFQKAMDRHKKFFSSPVVKFLMRFKAARWLFAKIFVHKKDKISWPAWLPKTNSERVQNVPSLFKDHDTKWIATEKVDGMSTSFIFDEKNTYMVASHNVIVYSDKVKNSEKIADGNKYVDKNVWIEMSDKYDIKTKLIELKKKYKLDSVAIQGETYGSKIQKRDYSLKDNNHDLAVFHIWFNGQRLNIKRMIEVCNDLNLPTVAVFNYELTIPDSAEDLIKTVDSYKSAIDGGMIEGFVLYSQDGQLNYKCVSPSFLLKYH